MSNLPTGMLTWDEAFLSLRCTLLPDAIRAKYCQLIIGLFTHHARLTHSYYCYSPQYNTIQYKICKAPCCRGFRGAGEQDS